MLAKDPNEKDEGYGYYDPHSHVSQDAAAYLKAQAEVNAANPPSSYEDYKIAIEKLKNAQEEAKMISATQLLELKKHSSLSVPNVHTALEENNVSSTETFNSLEGLEKGSDSEYDRKLMGL